MDTLTKYNSLVPSLIGRQTNDNLYILFSAILGSILLAISSKIQIPLTPVPVTLQTLVVLVMAMFLGWRAAGAASFLYLAEGAIGLPVFAQGGGSKIEDVSKMFDLVQNGELAKWFEERI